MLFGGLRCTAVPYYCDSNKSSSVICHKDWRGRALKILFKAQIKETTSLTAVDRTSREGECFQSECKLICDDLIRLGYSNIVIDPSVRLTYKIGDARRRQDPDAVSISICLQVLLLPLPCCLTCPSVLVNLYRL